MAIYRHGSKPGISYNLVVKASQHARQHPTQNQRTLPSFSSQAESLNSLLNSHHQKGRFQNVPDIIEANLPKIESFLDTTIIIFNLTR